MSEQKNPLVVGLISIIPQAISLIGSLVKDKKIVKSEAVSASATTSDAVVESVKDMVSGTLSSKRLLNIGGSALIITLAMSDISLHGITKPNLCLIALGVVYSLGMSLITWLSERK